MIKIWAILEDVGSEYTAYYPTVLADSVEAISQYVKENNIVNPTIVYKELDGAFKDGYDESDDSEPDWSYWEGEKMCKKYTWRNRKTGEFDPDLDNKDLSDEEWDDWEDGYIYEIYKDGKLIKTYFE